MNDQQTDPEFRLDLSDAGDELEGLPEPRPADEAPAPEADEPEIEIEMSAQAAAYVEHLQQELAEAVAARQRALADFRNFQRRSLENERKAIAGGARGVILALLPVLDHFDLALNIDPEKATVQTLLNGVRIVRDEITKALQLQGVEIIDPQPGDEFNPNEHEAILRQAEEGIAPNGIVRVMQPGYRLGDMVLRPAKVAIAPAEDEE